MKICVTSVYLWFTLDIRMPGPDASVKDASYESREYFSHNDFTYYDEEFEINKLRLPQPSPVTKEES